MCKVGDIILINSYIHGDKIIDKHSFVVLNNEGGKIQGLDYDLVCNVMSSFKDENHRLRKLNYSGNYPITAEDSNIKGTNKKDGYIKAEQFYYFNIDKIDYIIIGSMKKDAFNQLIEFIEKLDIDIKIIIDNL